ncbi:ABC transporter permease [Panacibacter ginsenosidivorans]|uniref:ABC transporter permease n=1 Tax=Panacibacter ginsenosidivorans TaxID=1813871 RepID=A0A5B8VCQ1_9BACT|nr:ABC transporter permease [Panacibacter ginsenosidivorans]QEC68078.1 ABC transporter permease [Panacibacter ginsenosidivorans]
MFKSYTYKSAFIKRLLKNKGAVFGTVVILIAFVAAMFAYFIAPDNSPYANRIIPEIANKKAGFTIQLVQIKKDSAAATHVNFFEKLLNGEPDTYSFVPVVSYSKTTDSIIAQKFIDDGITERVSFSLSQLAAIPVIEQKFTLGTDKFGRDIASRLIVGTRVSLSVGLITVIISLTIGILLGALAGYFKGWVDDVIMWLINVIWSIPTLLLVFAITLLLGKGFWQVFIAVGLTMWVNVARLVRGQVLAVRELEYIEATRALGFSYTRTIVLHILPNILGPVMVIAASNFASAIVIEAGLSFLGVGVQPPQPSWGLMIKENYNFIITNNPMLALEPGIAIMLLVLAFNLLGNGLRDALNVKEKI